MEQQRTTRGYSQGSEHRFLTTNYTNLHEWVPRGARNGKKKTTTGTTINNKGQQMDSSRGSERFYHESSRMEITCKSFSACRKKILATPS